MIYLDGSRFFFDIEGCFSDRVSAARLEHQADEHDPAAEEICRGFADFFGTKPEMSVPPRIMPRFSAPFCRRTQLWLYRNLTRRRIYCKMRCPVLKRCSRKRLRI